MAHVYVEPAPASIFKLVPDSFPEALHPPSHEFSVAYPFNIDPEVYTRLLDVQIPVTISIVYATAVWALNKYNKSRKNKPWGISKTKAFFCFVIAHNVGLAVYSGWTTVGMFRAVRHSLPPLDQHWSAVRFTDALCKMSGPRGITNGVSYNPLQHRWTTLQQDVRLIDGQPDPSDVGRLWNEGLGYYGWIFYLSKFYEVVDTLIILAKGKRSSFLQTYHHAGAMFGMWTGIRYMSPPIWMFVQINSFIHTVMYSYYTISALGIRVPIVFKRTLTTMQIVQLVTGASYAMLHLVISYDVPFETRHVVTREITSVASSTVSAVVSVATATAHDWLKKLALRAAGEEGLAGNVGRRDALPGSSNIPNIEVVRSTASTSIHEDVHYRWDTKRVSCIDTSGEVFAILLNVMYLMPLTYLFVRFFIRSYMRRSERAEVSHLSIAAKRLRASSTDAVKGVQREVREAMRPIQGSSSDLNASGQTPTSSSHPRSPGAVTPPTAKPSNRNGVDEAVWFGGGDKPKFPQFPPRGSSPSPSERRRSTEEAVRRAYEAAEIASRAAAAEEADSIISVESTQTIESTTTESTTSFTRTEARMYEVSGVDEILDAEEVQAEQEMQPKSS